MNGNFEIVGYTYRAEIFCPADTAAFINESVGLTGNVVVGIQDHETVETYLDRVAGFLGIRDRMDEATSDSDQFPKVIFGDQACDVDHDICPECGEDLMDHDTSPPVGDDSSFKVIGILVYDGPTDTFLRVPTQKDALGLPPPASAPYGP